MAAPGDSGVGVSLLGEQAHVAPGKRMPKIAWARLCKLITPEQKYQMATRR
jgi:hypothetical protein